MEQEADVAERQHQKRSRTQAGWRFAIGAAAVPVLLWPGVAGAEAAAGCTAGTGPYQRQLEKHLLQTVNGHQSAADCEAIRQFQQRNDVRPADGYAGLATYRMMLVAEARKDPNAAKKCPVRSYKVACVDLTRQLVWVQKGRKVLFGPVPARTGKDGYETRSGWHRVYWRNRDHYSTIYNNAPMPFSQFFSGGQAFHGVYGDLFKGGSHGCVNLQYKDAQRLWKALQRKDAVYVWGVKAGTRRNIPAETAAPLTVGDPPPATKPTPPSAWDLTEDGVRGPAQPTPSPIPSVSAGT